MRGFLIRASVLAALCVGGWATANLVGPTSARQASTLIQSGSTLPATCAEGVQTSVFIRTGVTDPGLYWCGPTDTWNGPLGTGGGSGDVTAAANLADHALLRGDGGAKGLQDSGIAVDDADHVTGMASLTLPNAGLHLLDTNASHDLILAPGSNLTADRTLTIATGDANAVLDLRTATSYTPTWTASGTAPSLGNGSLTGGWVQHGKLVFFSINLTPGSTTTFGTGVWSFTLPVTSSGAAFLANANMFDAGTNFRTGLAQAATNTTFQVLTDQATNTISATVPFTWANGDYLLVTGFYTAS